MKITGLIALLVMFVILISFIRNKYVRIVLSVLFGLFFCIQLSSIYIGNSFVDYKYYMHFNLNALSMAGGFKMGIVRKCLTYNIGKKIVLLHMFCSALYFKRNYAFVYK